MGIASTYLYYDLETSGLSLAFDQVMQYAAIRLNKDGEIIDESMFRVALSDDVIPDPRALLVHGQSIGQCQEGLGQDEAIRAIHRALNMPGTTSGGYNTLGFDDEFVRFSFDRYLLPPYTHQYANQCGRFDLYPMTVLFALYKPEVLSWPTINGEISLKLEALNAENDLVSNAKAHDALEDVRVTIALAKRLQSHTKMYHYAFGYFDKKTDLSRMRQLPTSYQSHQLDRPLALYVEGRIGRASAYQAPIIGLGGHQVYTNQSIWLRLDMAPFEQYIEEEKLPYVIKKKAGEPGFMLPLIERYTKAWDPDRMSLVERNLRWCQKHSEQLTFWAKHFCHEIYPEMHADADASIYMGFRSKQEQSWAERFWLSPWSERARQVGHWHGRMKEQGLRILWRHAPDHLTQEHHQALDAFLLDLSHGEGVDHRGERRRQRQTVQDIIDALRGQSELSTQDQSMLEELEQYLEMREKRISEGMRVHLS